MGISSVFRWDDAGYNFNHGRPGPRSNRKLDSDRLVSLLEARSDMMLKELAEELGDGISTVSYSLKN